MQTLTRIVTRLASFAGASAIGAAAPLIITGNPDWWMAAIGAAVPHTALIVSNLLRAYGQDGKLTKDEEDAAFEVADK